MVNLVLFPKKNKQQQQHRTTDSADLELFSRRPTTVRSNHTKFAIQLQDSLEDDASDSKDLPSTTRPGQKKLKLKRLGSISSKKSNKAFQKLGLSKSDDSSVSFDVSSSFQIPPPPSTTTTSTSAKNKAWSGSEFLLGTTTEDEAASKSSLPSRGFATLTDHMVPSISKPKNQLFKLTSKLGGGGGGGGGVVGNNSAHKFHKLNNIEGSHNSSNNWASSYYEPPSDYVSMVGSSTNNNPSTSIFSKLQLQQIASQSFATNYSPPPQRLRSPEGSPAYEPPPPASSEQGSPQMMTGDKSESEFRQFVFDKDFSTIEAIHVEKSDSGTGGDDIFRMAAVETVARMTIPQKEGTQTKKDKKDTTNTTTATITIFSPTKKNAAPQKLLPLSSDSSTHRMSEQRDDIKGQKRSSNNQTRTKHPSPSFSRSTLSGNVWTGSTDDQSFEDFSKQRFQDLVKRNGKLLSPQNQSRTQQRSPVPSASSGVPSKTTAHQQRMASDVSSAASRLSAPHPNQHKTRRIPTNDPKNPLSPLRTNRQFGNIKSGQSTTSFASSQQQQQQHSRKLKPPKAITTTTDFSVISTVSNAGATISTGPDENERVPQGAGGIRGYNNNTSMTYGTLFDPQAPPYDLDDDPFHVGQDDHYPAFDDSAWDVAKAPKFQSRRTKKVTTSSIASSSRDNSSLIESIQQATNKQRSKRHNWRKDFKPDPSPRGVPHSSSDSVLDFTPAHEGGRSYKKHSIGGDEIVMSMSDSMLLERDDRDASQLAFVTTTSSSNHARPHNSRSKAPSGVPEHAILASMLFRQTEVFASPEHAAPSPGKRVKPVIVSHHHPHMDPPKQQHPPQHQLEVPPAIHTSSAASVVSSVTEEASTFYQKNLMKTQAHNALNNYHILRSKQVQQHQSHQQLHSHSNAGPPRKWVSSTSSRKTTSSTGRPTWLDRVEEEHMRMFNE